MRHPEERRDLAAQVIELPIMHMIRTTSSPRAKSCSSRMIRTIFSPHVVVLVYVLEDLKGTTNCPAKSGAGGASGFTVFLGFSILC